MAAFESAGSSLMPLAIAAFRHRHPAVELSLALREPEPAVAMLRAGELELALGFDAGFEGGATTPRWEGIERRPLLEDRMFLALPADHPLVHKRRVSLADVAADAWVAGPPGCECSRILERACNHAGFEPRVGFQSDDYLAIQGFVAAGVGVALIPDLGLTTIRDDVVIRSLGAQAPVRRVWAATLESAHRSPATVEMLDLLSQVAASYVAERGERALAAVA